MGQETVLYSFCSSANCTDGKGPAAGLIQDAAGNLYGTTPGGGVNGAGTVFELEPPAQPGDDWTENVLYSFCSAAHCTDGANPYAGLIQDAAGNLYGTTPFGGNSNSICGGSCGTVYKLDSTGKETVLYSFCGVANCADGYVVFAGLIQDAAGNLYGTTQRVGANPNPTGGAVFKLDKRGHETVVAVVCCNLVAGLVRDAEGNLYGTTVQGGYQNEWCAFGNGCGTVFKVDRTGSATVLHTFCNVGDQNGLCWDGYVPRAGLVQDAAGNLYGTSSAGVGYNNGGNVFKIVTRSSVNITLTSSPNPSQVDQSVTFSATVSGNRPTPTGSVTFAQGKTELGTVTLADGKATLTTTFTKSGEFPIKASYSGDDKYRATKCKPLKQLVEK